jgi:hypothetical protein
MQIDIVLPILLNEVVDLWLHSILNKILFCIETINIGKQFSFAIKTTYGSHVEVVYLILETNASCFFM